VLQQHRRMSCLMISSDCSVESEALRSTAYLSNNQLHKPFWHDTYCYHTTYILAVTRFRDNPTWYEGPHSLDWHNCHDDKPIFTCRCRITTGRKLEDIMVRGAPGIQPARAISPSTIASGWTSLPHTKFVVLSVHADLSYELIIFLSDRSLFHEREPTERDRSDVNAVPSNTFLWFACITYINFCRPIFYSVRPGV